MGVIIRGAKNAFRNWIRTISVTLILAISIGLALVMLLSYQAVNSRIETVKSTIGNTISISPAGMRGFEGGGEPLTSAQMATVKSIEHVTGVSETLIDHLETGADTSIVSAVEPGTLGNRFKSREGGASMGTQSLNSSTNRTFSLPIMITGLSDASTITANGSNLSSGTLFDTTKSDNVAVIGTSVATKNNLSVGSTFTAYKTTLTVSGIFDSGNEFGNNGIYMPIKTLQSLSGQTDQISSAVVTVDSITNLESATTAVKTKLGTDKADVTNGADSATQALTPLENIKTTSLYSLIGALVAGAIITLLIMIMIVRERRREIGVLKAIGASNIGVVIQFVTESLVLTMLGGVVGIVGGIVFSNPVLNALVSNNTTAGRAAGGAVPVGGGGGMMHIMSMGSQLSGGVRETLQNLQTTVGPEIILWGILAAIAIAIVGSAIPAWLIAKVKPAEVMRGE